MVSLSMVPLSNNSTLISGSEEIMRLIKKLSLWVSTLGGTLDTIAFFISVTDGLSLLDTFSVSVTL